MANIRSYRLGTGVGDRSVAGMTPPSTDARALTFAVSGIFCIAFSPILVRLVDLSPSTVAFFRCAYAVPVLGVLAWRERTRYGKRARGQLRRAVAAGVLFALDLIFWHNAIEAVGGGLATVLGNTQVVLVGVLAWLIWQEKLHLGAVVAIPVVTLGVVLISGAFGADAYGDDPVAGVIFGLLTGASYAGFILFLRSGSADQRRPASPLFDATWVAAVTSLAAGMALGELQLSVVWPAHGWLVLLALTSQVLGWLLIGTSLPRLPAVLTSVLLTLQPVGSLVLAMVLLGEQPSPTQLIGALVILAGIVVANLGRRKAAVGAPATAATAETS